MTDRPLAASPPDLSPDLSKDELLAARGTARRASESFRLPFRRRAWKGAVGNWAGTGVGSSIDFQDHRPYLPGDDPRYIDWQAYARSGSYTMKLYREEVSPSVDLILDVSGSMHFDEAKRRRSLELFFFAAESALGSGSSIRCWLAAGADAHPAPAERLKEELWHPFAGYQSSATTSFADGFRIPLRAGSLRVLVSDCLFPSGAERLTQQLVAGKGHGVILAPSLALEADPDWVGNVELLDCESEVKRLERFDESRLAKYQRAYRRHFQMWGETCRRRGIAFARLDSEDELVTVLKQTALASGAVEPKN